MVQMENRKRPNTVIKKGTDARGAKMIRKDRSIEREENTKQSSLRRAALPKNMAIQLIPRIYATLLIVL